VGIDRGDGARRFNCDQAARDIGDQPLAQPLGPFGAPPFEGMELRQFSLFRLELFDERLKGIDDEFAFALCRRRAHGAAARRFDHPSVRPQEPADEQKHQPEPEDQGDDLIAEQVDEDLWRRPLAADAKVEPDAQADEQKQRQYKGDDRQPRFIFQHRQIS